MSARRHLAASLLLATLTGCVTAATTAIPHPLTHAGAVSANRIATFDQERAGFFGIPATALASDATLMVFDRERVCFGVTVRAEQANEALALPRNWRVFLRASGGFESMEPVFGPPSPPYQQSYQGTVPRQVFAGYYTDCMRVGYAMNCQQRPRYVTLREPAMVNVTTGSESVCFAHRGRLDANVTEMTLHLDATDDVTRRMAFRWRLVR